MDFFGLEKKKCTCYLLLKYYNLADIVWIGQLRDRMWNAPLCDQIKFQQALQR